MRLPAQMGELRERLLKLRESCLESQRVSEQMGTSHVLEHVDAALAVLPVPHDDQQGGTAGPFILSLAKLRSANEQRQREWDKAGGIDLSYRGNELAGEVGEACNVIKKLERERLGIRGSRATRQQLQEELADVVICVDLIAMATEIDLGEAVTQKFNATSEKVGLATRLGPSAPSVKP